MSDKQRWTKDLSELAQSLVNSTMEDPTAVKALEVVNSFAKKEKSTAEDIVKLLNAVQSNSEKVIAEKVKALETIADHCGKFAKAQLGEGALGQLATLIQLFCVSSKDSSSSASAGDQKPQKDNTGKPENVSSTKNKMGETQNLKTSEVVKKDGEASA